MESTGHEMYCHLMWAADMTLISISDLRMRRDEVHDGRMSRRESMMRENFKIEN